MDTLCRVCTEKAAKCTSLSSKIGDSSNLSFLDFLNKCTTLNAREGDGLPQSLCSVCDKAMKAFYSFMKLAEKSDLILREALKRLAAEGRYKGHQETPCEERAERKEIAEESEDFNQGNSFHCQNLTGPFILDIVKEEPCVSESTSIVDVEDAVINESANLESNLDYPEGSIQKLDGILSCIDSRPASIDTEHTDSEGDVPISLLKKRLAKSGDETDSDSSFCEEITRSETIAHGCEICRKKFYDKKTLNNHLKNHKGPQKCDECDKEFKTIYNLRQHLFTHANPLKPIKCKQCGKKLKHMLSLHSHMKVHTNRKPFKCEYCEKSFVEKSSLRDHSCSKGEKVECEICGKSFSRNYLERFHRRSHKGTSKCNLCGQQFTHSVSLSRHMKLHIDACKCETCGKSLSSKVSYTRHMNLYHPQQSENSKNYCGICGKSFSSKYYLDIHMENHLGITRKCYKCGKRFSSSCSLRRHMKWHNNPTPFKCEKCGRLFDRRYRYNSHMEICEHAVQEEQLETEHLPIRSKTKKVVISHDSAAMQDMRKKI